METGSAQDVRDEARKLKYAAPLVNFNSLIIKYKSAASGRSYDDQWQKEKIQAVAEMYQDLTGENIEDSTAANRWD